MVATILELTYNLALLVALSVLSGFIRQRRSHPAWGAILQGLLFGGAAVIGMMKPLVLGPGLIFDGRSVMLSLCGLFFGPVAVGVAGGMALLYRTLLGGTGVHMGGLVIASSALLGLGFHHLWLRRGQSLTTGRLWRLGLLVHVVMVLLMFTLPAGTGLIVIKRLSLPILLAYPLVTVLIGKVLASQEAGMRSVAALKESEAKHRLLIENSHDIIYTLTPEGVFTFVSPAWTALLGHPINQVVGQPFEPFLHRDDVALCKAWLQKVIETGERQEGVEYRVQHLDGSWRWHTSSAVPTRNEKGSVTGFEGTARDITERKAAEEALHEKNAELERYFSSSLDLLCIADAGGHFIRLNPEWEKALGYSLQDLEGRSFLELVHPEDMEGTLAAMSKLGAQEQVLSFENRYRCKDGSYRWIEWRSQPQGNLVYAAARDITERKQAEDALRSSENRFKTMFNEAPLGIALIDSCTGHIHAVNPVFAHIAGRSTEEMADINWIDITHPDDVQEDLDNMARMNAGEIPGFQMRKRYLHPDGEAVWIHMTIAPVRVEAHAAPRHLCMIMDITERNRTDEALRESEQKYRALFDGAGDGIFIHNAERMLAVNPLACERLGYTQPELLAMPPSAVDTPEQSQYVPERTASLLAQGHLTFETEHQRKNGSRVPTEAISRMITWEGHPAIMSICRDITERKKAEEELTHSKEALMRQNAVLSALLKSIPIGVFMVEAPSGKPLVANEMACELLGRGILPNVSKENLSEVYSSYKMDTQDRYPLEEMPIIRGMNGEASHVDDMMVERPDGTQALLEVFGSPVTDDQGRVWASVVSFLDITERKVAEQALGESEQKYRTLIDHLSAGIVVHGPDTGILLSNGMASTLLGLTAEQMQGKTAMDPRWCFLEEDGSAMPLSEYPVNRVFASGEGFQSQVVGVRCPERAEPTWVLCNAYSVRDAKGQVVQAVITFTDITDRRRAEEALRLTRFSIENASDAMYWVTPDGRIVDVNETGCRSLGYSRAELLALTVPELDVYLDAGDWPGHFAELRQLGSMTFESEQRHRDGRLIPVEVVENYLKFGEEEWNCAIIRDITDRKQAEEALHLSEQKFRTLFENLTEGVALHELVKDAAGKILDYRLLDVNPAYQHHTGLEALTAPGRMGTEIYGTEVPPYLEEFSQVALGGEPYAFETFFPPLDKHFHISVISPRPGQFATVFEDITDRKRREEELKQKNAEMERFTYMISHDLKSPLVTVRTFLGYLEQDLEQGKAERVVKDMGFIRDATGKMGRLLEDLLEVSRVGRVVNPLVRVTLADLIQEALAAVAGAISTRGVAIQVEVPLVTFLGDRPRLEELWQNLVENAVKYMGDQPCPRIELGVEGTGADTVFFVRDNGQGIDPRFQDKVFGLFEQLDPASEDTGLGLALVKRIVELYEGRIWLESEGLGQGTCFRFTLPLALKVTPKNRKEGARP